MLKKRPLFRSTLNKAIASKQHYTKKMNKINSATNKKINLIMSKPVGKTKYKHLSGKTIKSLEAVNIIKSHEKEYNLFKNKKHIAEQVITQQKKIRKAPIVGQIRLAYAGKKARTRLKNIKKIRETRIAQNKNKYAKYKI